MHYPQHWWWLQFTISMEHALDCRVWGLVTQCHNEFRDAIGDLATLCFDLGAGSK